MKVKHIQVIKDRELLRAIYKQVNKDIKPKTFSFFGMLWLKLLVYLAGTLGCYVLLFRIENPFLFCAAFVLYGFMSMLFAFNFSHDFSHNTIFKKKSLNHFFFTLIYSLVGAHAEAWKERHVNSHHFAPNVAGYDSDLEITSLIRVIPNSSYRWFHKFQHIYAPLAYMTYSLFWVFIKDFVLLFSKETSSDKKTWKYQISFWLQKSFYLGYIIAVPIIFSNQTWSTVLLSFVIMHLSQSLFLLLTFFMTHHVEETSYPTTNEDGSINSSWFMNQIGSSNDMHPFSELANFIFGGFNCHIAHHLFPHIHHIHYPKLNRILYNMLNQYGIIPNQTSYFGGIVSHLRLLKRMGAINS